ncbi:MAG: CVNH domain-containing protein [Acidobacteriota bacterium]|nr:CVNH domain-containing protein [Acidobacteriota bacterium]
MKLMQKEKSKMSPFGIRKACLALILMSLSFTGTNAARASYSVPTLEPSFNENAVSYRQNNRSTFHETCTNISVNGNVLMAECQRENGRYRRSSIEIRGIHNDNGNLEYTRNSRDRSTFHESCRNVRLDERGRLTARCERMDGSYSRTSIMLRGIHNNNGRLEYTRD